MSQDGISGRVTVFQCESSTPMAPWPCLGATALEDGTEGPTDGPATVSRDSHGPSRPHDLSGDATVTSRDFKAIHRPTRGMPNE